MCMYLGKKDNYQKVALGNPTSFSFADWKSSERSILETGTLNNELTGGTWILAAG